MYADEVNQNYLSWELLKTSFKNKVLQKHLFNVIIITNKNQNINNGGIINEQVNSIVESLQQNKE